MSNHDLNNTMKLYHGTAAYNLQGFIKNGIKLKRRGDYKRPSFSVSLSFREASFFALRKTPMSDLSATGIVLEFEAEGLVESEDFIPYNDAVLRDEQELVIFNPDKLTLAAYHKYNPNGWERIRLEEALK